MKLPRTIVDGRDRIGRACPYCEFAVTLPTSEMADSAVREHVNSIHDEISHSYTSPEPPPVSNEHPHIQDLVIEDIGRRKEMGIAKYGTALQGFNGRDPLTDAYQEALDLVQYLRQTLYERDLK